MFFHVHLDAVALGPMAPTYTWPLTPHPRTGPYGPDEQTGPYGPHIYIYIQSDHHARASIPNAWCTPTTLRTLRSLLPKIPFLGLRDTRVRTVFELLWRQRAAPCASASAPPAWAPCSFSSSGSVRRHVQVLQLRQRGHRVRSLLAAASGAMRTCFRSVRVGTVLEHL